MADKELNFIEFRYTDGSKQILEGKDAENWMNFNRAKIKVAHTIDPTCYKNWEWKRFDSKGGLISSKEITPDNPKPDKGSSKEKPRRRLTDINATNYNEY